jgi:hypothetical protein
MAPAAGCITRALRGMSVMTARALAVRRRLGLGKHGLVLMARATALRLVRREAVRLVAARARAMAALEQRVRLVVTARTAIDRALGGVVRTVTGQAVPIALCNLAARPRGREPSCYGASVGPAPMCVLAVEVTGPAVERVDVRLRVWMMALRARLLCVELHGVQRSLCLLVTAHAIPAPILTLRAEAVAAQAIREGRPCRREIDLHGVLNARLRLMAFRTDRKVPRRKPLLDIVALVARDALLLNVHDVPGALAILAKRRGHGCARWRAHRPFALPQRPPAHRACGGDGGRRGCEQGDPQPGAHGSPAWHSRQGSSLERLFE